MLQIFNNLRKTFLAAIAFYTNIPVPKNWELNFDHIASLSPIIGLIIGIILSLCDLALAKVNFPIFTRSVLIVAIWILLTGGLHLDGVIDTADGLAVTNREKKLSAMEDSVTGAYGVMAASMLLLLKTAALTDLSCDRYLGLISACGWGRWAQVAAIAFYPYLKPTGKGAFHKQNCRFPQDLIFGLVILLGLPLLYGQESLKISLGGIIFALLTGYWFYRQLGGHTGDTYGAVVEWTETFLLCLLTL